MAEPNSKDEIAALRLFEDILALPKTERLAAIEQNAEISDPIKSRAKELLIAHEGIGGSFMTGGTTAFSTDAFPTPDRVGAYRIVEEIGRGGMGLVLRGERDTGDFDHQVAIKMVLTGTLSANHIERFGYERQTLASLSHPGIARLFDGGETDDGLPYLIMELVEGRSLRRWYEDDRPTRIQRFAVLDQIIDALEFAHSRLVIHRDLTPENVIIDTQARAKLIDFGISSLQSAERPSPVESGQSGTPGFKAPEHVSGDGANIAIDIFALGKIAQFLLADLREPELDAITAKASAQNPEERYASVAAMGADLRRFRKGRAVHAFEGGGSYRAAKFLRRNWAPVAVAAGTVAIILTSVAALAVAFGNEREARQLAQERFDAVRDLANFQLFDVYDDLVPIDGTIEVREEIVDKSIFYLDALGNAQNVPPDVARDIGNGWLRMSQISGGASGNHVGDPEQAKVYAERSLEALKKVFNRQPDDPETRFAYGKALAVLAFQSLYQHGDSDQGYDRATRAIEVFDGLDLTQADYAAYSIGAWRALGDAHGWKNDLDKAGEAYLAGIALFQSLPEDMQASTTPVNAVAAAMSQQAQVYRHTDRPEKAFTQMRATIDLTEAMMANPNDDAGLRAARRNRVLHAWDLADMYRHYERWDESIEVAKAALPGLEEAIAANPDDIGWLEVKPQLLTAIAQSEHGRGQADPAIAAADEAIEILSLIRAKSGKNIGADLSLAVAWKDIAPVYMGNGRAPTGCQGLRAADAIFREYTASGDLSEYDTENNAKPVRAMLERCG
ncbi:MAG: serine/threonine-protein kinase [Pseudomonadota bacterium]